MAGDFEVRGAEQLAALSKQLKKASNGQQLRKDLVKTLREAAKPPAAEVKRTVTNLPISGSHGGGARARAAHLAGRTRSVKRREALLAAAGGHASRRAMGRFGLRRSIAAAVQIRVLTTGAKAAVRIRVDRSKLPPDQRKLPAAMEKGKWRHPTWGHDPWVTQTSKPRWFIGTIRAHVPAVQRQVMAAMQDTVNRIVR